MRTNGSLSERTEKPLGAPRNCSPDRKRRRRSFLFFSIPPSSERKKKKNRRRHLDPNSCCCTCLAQELDHRRLLSLLLFGPGLFLQRSLLLHLNALETVRDGTTAIIVIARHKKLLLYNDGPEQIPLCTVNPFLSYPPIGSIMPQRATGRDPFSSLLSWRISAI